MLLTNFLLPALGLLATSVVALPAPGFSPRAAAWTSGIDGICSDIDMAVEAHDKAKSCIDKIWAHAKETQEPAPVTADKIREKVHEMIDGFNMASSAVKENLQVAEKCIGYEEGNIIKRAADKVLYIQRRNAAPRKEPCNREKAILKLLKDDCGAATAALREIITAIQCFANESEENHENPGALERAREIIDGAGREMDDHYQRTQERALIW